MLVIKLFLASFGEHFSYNQGFDFSKSWFFHLLPYGFPQSAEAVFLTATAGLKPIKLGLVYIVQEIA